MKSRILSFVVVLLMLTPIVSAQKLWTLEACIDTALANNRNIKLQKLNYQSREINYRQAKNERLPNLNASMGQNFNFGRSLGVDNVYQNTNSQNSSLSMSTGLTLYDGFRIKNSIEARQAELQAAGADVEKMERDIILNVSTVFLQVLQNKELLQNAINQLQITDESIERREELIAVGRLAAGEMFELHAQRAKEELAVVQTENQLELSLLDLSQVLELSDFEGMDVATPTDLLVSEMMFMNPSDIYQEAINNRPEIRSAQYRLASSQKGVSIAKSRIMPSLSLGAQWGTSYYNMSNYAQNVAFDTQLKNNMSSGVGLSLSIPIFNRFDTKNQIESAQLQVENSRIEIENSKISIKKEIQQSYYNATAAKKRWDASQKSVEANQESYRYASQKYEVGRANQYEVNLAKSNLSQSISEETQAKYEYIFRLRILELMFQ